MPSVPKDTTREPELSQRLDFAQLRFLTIELTTPSYCPPPGSSSLLTEPLLFPLHSFSALHTLDLSSFRASHLDDAAYERVVAPWPELRCLKLGTTDALKWWPAASVRAVIAVLRSCPHLQTLHIVFNGSIPPPCPTMNDEEASERVEDGKDERAEVGQVNRWGVSNAHITQIHVGHSPIGVDIAGLKGLATCLGSVMPRLRTIQSEKELSNLAGRWRMVQDMLVRGDAVGLEVGCVT
ncbi:hypothetical protein L210DRAFT_2058464 [Boletus edulis BED1]|uniref:Uncharacterized protein n=1 Tax=Boletus edulis BED1 TaxID=1328754 RepID=A0AAD4C9F8_BOLED|nr:hypothetical protein L210DRAFT_2058464 [Boletus edulis BED1]